MFVGTRRRIFLLILAIVLAIAVGQVAGHAELVDAAPAPGAQLANSPTEIRLTFSEAAATGRITLLANGFEPVDGLEARSDPEHPEVIFTPVPLLDAGNYTVQWMATGADGHEISGSYAFTIELTGSDRSSALKRGIPLALAGLAVLLFGLAAIVKVVRKKRDAGGRA